ncbi:MAG: hypothetical protein ACI88G_001226 [Woeseiaceae bacterium]|jgi:hypothetical protein
MVPELPRIDAIEDNMSNGVMRRIAMLLLVVATATAATSHTHLEESVRSAVKKVVVVPGTNPASQGVTGTYEKDTPGLIGGIDEGSRVGTISKDIGGIPVSIPIPMITIPAAIFGGLSGSAKRQIQDFRDEMTEDLAKAANQPLTSDKLALDVFWGLRRLPGLDSKLFAPTTPVPADTDAVLYVNVSAVTIDVQGKEAILTTSATVTLRRLSDDKVLYERQIQYSDRDTLDSWTENENALWHAYANYARHYLGREVSAEVFDRVKLRHELRPLESANVARVKKDDWQNVSKSTTPTLAWELNLLGGDSYGPWTNKIDAANIFFDVEIYDAHQLVYAEKQVPGSQHSLAFEIEACKTYRWSVRPSYRIGSDIRFGEWMRYSPDTDDEDEGGLVNLGGLGSLGRKASIAPAYTQDFASLKIECPRR